MITFQMMMAAAAFLTAGCRNQPAESRSSVKNDPDQLILYIGTYTEKEGHVDGKATGIYIYSMDRATGQLTYTGVSPFTINPSFIKVHPNGKWLYAVNETGNETGEMAGSVSAFRLTDDGRKLELINTVSSAGNYPCHIDTDQTGRWAFAANYGSGTVALFPIGDDGTIGEAVSVDQHKGKGLTSRQESAHAHMIISSPDNRFIYSCDLGTDRIYIYRLDTIRGELTSAGDPYVAAPGSGPRHMTFHPNKSLAYVVNELNGTIACLKVDSLTGSLTSFQVVATTPGDNGMNASCADIHFTPSGKYLYASNRGAFNSIAMYSADPVTGELTFLGNQPVNGKTPRSFVIDPSGSFLLVANQDSDNVVTFRIDQATGMLTETGMDANIPTPVCLKFME